MLIQDQIPDFQQHLLVWFHQYQRDLPWRRTRDPYCIWVSEVMLQQTQVKTVLEYYPAFIRQFPDIFLLAQADLQAVLKRWERLGYYARARNLHAAARIVVEKYQGVIPAAYQKFRELPGVGDYIAAAVLSLAFGQAYSVVDGNVKRVLARVGLIDLPVNLPAAKIVFQRQADACLNRAVPADHNQALMELGAMICRPEKPECNTCPVAAFCQAFKTGQQDKFPVRQARKVIPEIALVAAVIHQGDRILIVRRPEHGLLGGLWEFPGGEILAGEAPTDACQRQIMQTTNLSIQIDAVITQVKHAYTHFKIQLIIFEAQYLAGAVQLNGPAEFRWIKLADLDQFPVTGATHKFLPYIK